MNLSKKLDNYAMAIVKKGINLQKGEKVRIITSIETLPFARLVMEKAYIAGAEDVYLDYHDEETAKIRFNNAPVQSFEKVTPWDKLKAEVMTEEKISLIFIAAPNPEVLAEVDPAILGKWTKTQAHAFQKYSQARSMFEVRWTIAAAATNIWAKKIFPDIETDEAYEKLWDYILKCSHSDGDDPIAALEEHEKILSIQSKKLHGKKYKKLYYKGPDTDLEVVLLDNQLWFGGGVPAANGLKIMPNIPTEEITTSPHKLGTNGRIHSTMPLVYNGNIIENLWFEFKDGKVVDFGADTGAELIKQYLETDEGANYLGEVALVPITSPIYKLNTLFYNTLYDENASCHLAIGNGLPMCFEGAKGKSKEEMEEMGLNYSKVHLDFMVGSEKLDIIGEFSDGTQEYVFKNGMWAI